MLTLESLVS